MYRVTYIHKTESEEHVLYEPGDLELALTSGKANLGMGKSGELDLVIPITNPAREDLVCLTDEIILYRDETEIWRGRPITLQVDFDLNGSLTCEGVLSYLVDTYFHPFEFSGSPKEFLQMVIDYHNSQVEAGKQFTIGEITVEDSNDYISRSSIYYDNTLDLISDKLIGSLGGYLRVRIENGIKYLDYLSSYGTEASQPVQFGENLLDFAEEIEYSSLATVLLPLGAKIQDEDGNDTDEYLTVESVNNGSIFVVDEGAVESYGWIVSTNEWEDVTLPENLLAKAKERLAQLTSAVSSFEINAVDLSKVSDAEAINLGDMVLIRSDPHGVNQMVELTELELDLLDPTNDILKFGTDSATLTSSQASADRQVQNAVGSITMRLSNLSTTIINAVYGNIEEIVSNTITTDFIQSIIGEFGYITADELEATIASFGYVTTEYLESTYATLEYINNTFLSSDSAVIQELTANLANITSVLMGNAGVGDLQSIHLTADNAVIDDALIVNALIGYAGIAELLAGTIYTDYIKIANNEGQNLWIDGSTIQITDENGVIRVQIGEDGEGDYNLYLWDSTGTLIWNAYGLTAEGLTGNGAIIKNDAVADDAAISGYKLDIESVTSYLNEYGGVVVDASKVTINDTTLSAAYTTMVQEIAGLTENYTVLQTAFEVVQGSIDAKIWQTDIDNATSSLSDQYSELSLNLDSITAQVGSMETTIQQQFDSVQEAINSIVVDADGVDAVEVWYAIGLSHTIPPCSPDGTIAPAIVGLAIVGQSIVGYTDTTIEGIWSQTWTEPGEGEYLWAAVKVIRKDGTVVWGDPWCVTDYYLRSTMRTVQASITLLQDSISMIVSSEEVEDLAEAGSTLYGLYSSLEMYAQGIEMSVSSLETQINGDDETTGLTKQVADLALDSSSITAIVEQCLMETVTDEDGDEVIRYTTMEDIRTELQQYADSISLTISGTISDLQETAEGLVQTVEQYATYFSFTADGLSISQSDSPFSALFGPEALEFLENGQVITYVSNSMFHMIHAEVEGSLTIADFRWQVADNGNLNLVWIGEG